uniref:Uncharacterized protein n=1 Tax=Anguilla anguilla TaxID=7936 RepID=A0A0E9T7F0_ANGAN
MMRLPLSTEVSDPTCLNPRLATTLSDLCSGHPSFINIPYASWSKLMSL